MGIEQALKHARCVSERATWVMGSFIGNGAGGGQNIASISLEAVGVRGAGAGTTEAPRGDVRIESLQADGNKMGALRCGSHPEE